MQANRMSLERKDVPGDFHAAFLAFNLLAVMAPEATAGTFNSSLVNLPMNKSAVLP
jgi:hypothetical protein